MNEQTPAKPVTRDRLRCGDVFIHQATGIKFYVTAVTERVELGPHTLLPIPVVTAEVSLLRDERNTP